MTRASIGKRRLACQVADKLGSMKRGNAAPDRGLGIALVVPFFGTGLPLPVILGRSPSTSVNGAALDDYIMMQYYQED